MRIAGLFCFILVLCSVVAEARPKIGLVLGGGGARGAAHIGVLKYLREQHIPIDIVTGTSMGSIVGGLYASGMTPDEIEQIIVDIDWDHTLTDDVPREERSMQRKRVDDFFSISGRPGFGDGRLKFPSGVIQGQNTILMLQKLTYHVNHIDSFDKLPIPFRAVATDIVIGEQVVLSSGSLAHAMRASMAVPAIFSPLEIDGRLLVDGGLTNNLPMDVARQLGAEVLIVVDVSTPLRTRDALGSALTITDQLTRILTGRNSQDQLKTLEEQDILIQPVLGNITAAQFPRANEAIVIGYDAAVASAGKLQKLSVEEHKYLEGLASVDRPEVKTENIASIRLQNNSGLADEMLTNLITFEKGDKLNLDLIDKNVTAMHALGNFELVGYQISNQEHGADVILDARAKSWGPNYLHFGVDVQSQFDSDTLASLLVGYTREELNDKGAEWTTVLGVGADPRLQTFWYQPLTVDQTWYYTASLGYTRTAVLEFEDDDIISETNVKRWAVSTGIGYDLGSAAVQLSIDRLTGETDLVSGVPSTPEQEFDDAGVALILRYDTRDDINFPRHGSLIRIRAHTSNTSLGADSNYDDWVFQTAFHRSWGQHNFGVGFNLGGISGDSPPSKLFRIGGYGQLTGLRRNQISGKYKGILKGVYYRRYDGIKIAPAFIGAAIEYGGAWDDKDDISSDTSILSVAAFVATDTPVGMFQLGVAITDEDEQTMFLRVGRLF